ncbi:MAG TPA: hypothetical protein VIG79_17505 [Lapillicoccus sp.]|uniref:hypothetical protein n=1 Tax=Lapillicoccus sp. TaxID=1909287 RepID=UPI002F92AFA5
MPTIVLILATLTSGLVAGVYVFYAHTVMPGLGRAGDRTFVAGFQALDRAILNPWFMVSAFLGAPVLTAVAALMHSATRRAQCCCGWWCRWCSTSSRWGSR